MENQTITDEFKEEMQKLQPQHSSYQVKNDYCSDELVTILENKNILQELECSYMFMHQPFVTHQVVMKWLREKHNLCISPYAAAYRFGFTLDKCDTGSNICNDDVIDTELLTYEEAVEVALKYSLENFV